MIRELYQASLVGVPIVLNIRGRCYLRAGVPGLSPTIQVYSTLGSSSSTAGSTASRTAARPSPSSARPTG